MSSSNGSAQKVTKVTKVTVFKKLFKKMYQLKNVFVLF